MPQESITDQKEVLVLSWESALMDDKVAFTLVTLVEVLLWVDLKNVVTHLETNWLHLRGNFLARLLDVAEGFVGLAVEVWESFLPLHADLLENIWGDRELR